MQTPAHTVAAVRFNMCAVSRAMRLQELLALDAHSRHAAENGHDMRRIKRYWKILDIRSPHALWTQTAASVVEWVRQIHTTGRAAAVEPERVAAAMLLMPRRTVTPEYREQIQRLPIPTDTEALVIEDKDTAAAWLCNKDLYRWRSWRCLTDDGSWEAVPWTLAQTGRYVADLFAAPRLRSAMPCTSQARWCEGVPSLYCTVKAKCWADGRKTCTRDQHVCMRRIASWLHFPGRPYLRRVGRAWRWALRSMGHGVATPSMATAAADLRSRAGQLQPARARTVCVYAAGNPSRRAKRSSTTRRPCTSACRASR